MTAVWVLLLLATGVLAEAGGSHKRSPKYDILACASRVIHEKFEGHGYMFSWEEPRTSLLELSWPEAREFCRLRCMDLVSLESNGENQLVKARLDKGNQRYIWTSGRKCNFAGCDRPDLKPLSVYGWFWAGSLRKMPPTTNRLDADWSDTGGLGIPQPDDREHQDGGPEEECLAILNNFFSDGIRWHDIACHHRKPFVCEDSDFLLQSALVSNPELAAELAIQSQSHQPQQLAPTNHQPTSTKKTRLEPEPQPPHHDQLGHKR